MDLLILRRHASSSRLSPRRRRPARGRTTGSRSSTRGLSGPDLFPEVEPQWAGEATGSRSSTGVSAAATCSPGWRPYTATGTGDLSALRGRRWDAAIDTCGYVPRVVQGVCRAVGRCGGPLHLRLQHLRVFGRHRAGGRRRCAGGGVGRSHGRGGHGGDVRGAQGAVRAGGRGGDARQGAQRASRFDLRPPRSHGPFHVLAAKSRRRRRGPGPRPSGAPGAIHRREGPRGVDRKDVRGATNRNVQRHGSGLRTANGKAVGGVRGGQRWRRTARLGVRGIPGSRTE